MGLVLKKKVALDYLGEEYKNAYIEFQSIPAKDLPDVISKVEAGKEDSKVLIPLFISVLSQYFIGGQADGDIVKSDIDNFDAELVIRCFQILTGQDIDPKANGQLTNTSSTVPSEAPM